MTTIEKSLVARLRLWSGLTDLVRDRIYPGQRTPGESLPCVSFTLTRHEPVRSLDTAGGLARAEFQIVAWALTHERAREVADAIIGDPNAEDATARRLEGFRGWMGSEEQRHFVQSCEVQEDSAEDEPPTLALGKKKGTEKVALNVVIFYER